MFLDLKWKIICIIVHCLMQIILIAFWGCISGSKPSYGLAPSLFRGISALRVIITTGGRKQRRGRCEGKAKEKEMERSWFSSSGENSSNLMLAERVLDNDENHDCGWWSACLKQVVNSQ